MKTIIFSILGALLMVFIICNSCKKNTSPIAGMSGDSTSFVGDSLLLDGSSSSDADIDSLSYRWSVIAEPKNAGDVLHILDPVSCLFIPTVGGSYTVQLIVHDGIIDSDPVSKTIEVIDFHGKWAMLSRTPPLPTPAEIIDTVVYNEDGTFEYYSYYKYQGELGLTYKGKGKRETPAGIMEWTEVTMPMPPTMALQTFTKDNDPHGAFKRMNTPVGVGDFKSVYFLFDNGNTLKIQTDANNDGDFDDINTDVVIVWTRVE